MRIRLGFAALALALAGAPLTALGAPAKAGGGDIPDVGHGQTGPWDYNIWGSPKDAKQGQGNCHNAADMFLVAARKKGNAAGILVCGGKPESSPAYHTANWIVLKTKTCMVNWGDSSCCWSGTASPPDISSGKAKQCAQKTCGDQYGADTRCLAPGQFVERPGPYVCALVAAGGQANQTVDALQWAPERKGACLKCCQDRADMWTVDPKKAGESDQAFQKRSKKWESRRKAFYDRCTPFCRNFNKEINACTWPW